MYLLIWLYTSLLFLWYRLLYHVRIEGWENFPQRGPFIISSNEIGPIGSTLSALVVARLVYSNNKLKMQAFGDEWMWNMIWAGIFTRGGARPLFPHGHGQAAGALLVALEALRTNKVVAMNPEGEMSWDGTPVPFKGAVAWLALRTGAPVVFVCATRGAYDVQPKWAERPHWTGRFGVRIGKPVIVGDGQCDRVTDEMIAEANRTLGAEMNRLVYGEEGEPRP